MNEALIKQAVDVARRLQLRAAALQTPAEKRQQAELDRMLQNASDKATLVQMTDQAFRPRSSNRVADQLTHILDVQGIPRFFSSLDRAMLRGFQTFGGWLPGVSVPLVKEHMRHETANVILPAEREMLATHLSARAAHGVRMNVNFLGEAILSEGEAERRLMLYLNALQQPETEVFSVKISTLYSQMSLIAREHTIAVLCDRLERLYRSADHARYRRPDGSTVAKFIYLDMEEYRDLSLTCEIFMRTLESRGLEKTQAGIVLQAYIPDSYRWQQRLNTWARERVAGGGGEITLRIVKGANMEMERHEASVKGWPQAPFDSKPDTDANYKRMLHEGLRPENLAAVKLGIASHNLFDVAYALTLATENKALHRVQFEMLEGMANHQRRALFEETENLLLYAPVCHQDDFLSAIGYLIRRLDENTGPENFLSHAFKLVPDSQQWQKLEQGFRQSFTRIPSLSDAPRRHQDRRQEPPAVNPIAEGWQHFHNEPDTDWALPQNAEWASSIIAAWTGRVLDVPLVIDGCEVRSERQMRDCLDPSRPRAVVGAYRQANAEDIAAAIACAQADDDGWRSLAPQERQAILRRAAAEFRKARAELMGAALANCGKTLAESDPEVSEAIDFVEFYAETARWFMEDLGSELQATGKGVVLVVSPWNFPIAIPTGGVAAALAAGNTVILKPASDSILPAWELCQCFWRGGVSRKALQFAPCAGAREGSILAQDPALAAVILTGGTETALTMLEARPDMPLIAETGGKNATIVTALSDRELAIKNVLHSAFSHAGQKCSATSLLLLETEVYNDPQFKRMLVEAAESLTVSSAWNLAAKVGPLIRPPQGELSDALLTLDAGETWALMPRKLDGNPCLWSPGIKWGVQPGSFAHMTEFFGPVLSVIRYNKLDDAIAIVNQTGYGLTSGLESLDDREQTEWLAGIRAGNLYINRSTVGAIVLRQPFGGLGKSAFGPGIKAGGPNYVAQLMTFAEADKPEPDLDTLLDHYAATWADEFAVSHDHFRLIGQDNQRRYTAVAELRIRVHPDDTPFEIVARVAAARTAGCRITISKPPGFQSALLKDLHRRTESWAGAIEFVEESDESLAAAIRHHAADRVRYASPSRVPQLVHQAANERQVYIATAPVLAAGRVELLWYVYEQSISFDYHRYGNLGARSGESRAPLCSV
jgi:RHH-type proline utilization regulon transcriptional repressor/proline dehydrogenase/delta 1-pyrroline-5-carboxylate dehydrogenase